MSETTEYAKLVKIKTVGTSARGFKAKLTLPSSKTLPRQDDYINFYVGLNSYECGVSVKNKADWIQNGVLKWRGFMNGEGATTYNGSFFDGATCTIALELNAQNKVEFRINDVLVRTFTNPVSSIVNPARLIIASYQSTGYTPPLEPWDVKHDQVRAFEMKYKTSSGTWVPFTDGTQVTHDEWPVNVSTPDGVKYNYSTATIGNAEVYASLKL